MSIWNSVKSTTPPPLLPLDLGHLARIESRLLPGEFSFELNFHAGAYVVRNSMAPIYRSGGDHYANNNDARDRMICRVHRQHMSYDDATARFLAMFGNLGPFMCSSLRLGRYDGDLAEFHKLTWALDAAAPGTWESRGVRDNETATITSPTYVDPITQKPLPFILVEYANREQCDDAFKFVVNARTDAEWLIEQMRPLVQAEFPVEGSAKMLVVGRNVAADIEHLQPFKLDSGGEIVSAKNEKQFIAEYIMPPDGEQRIAHINGDHYDCRWHNLRAVDVTAPHALHLEPEVINQLHQQAQLRGMTPNGFLKAIL